MSNYDFETDLDVILAKLNLCEYGLTSICMRADLLEGKPNTPEARYVLGDSDMGALWGVTESVRQIRAEVWEMLGTL